MAARKEPAPKGGKGGAGGKHDAAKTRSGQAKSTPAPQKGGKSGAHDEDSLVDRLADFAENAFSIASRGSSSLGQSLRLGRAILSRSPDSIRAMQEAGSALKDLREVAGLTRRELSEALEMRDESLIEAVENGTATLSFELILRLAAVLARRDPIPFVIRFTRTYRPELWQLLDDWGVGRVPLQIERERHFINMFRSHDEARRLSDEGFDKVLKFTRSAFEAALHFAAEMEGVKAAEAASREKSDRADRSATEEKAGREKSTRPPRQPGS